VFIVSLTQHIIICNNSQPSNEIVLLTQHGSKLHYWSVNSPTRSPQRTISIASTLNADNWDLASVMVWPTDEKSRSDCAELADMRIAWTLHLCPWSNNIDSSVSNTNCRCRYFDLQVSDCSVPVPYFSALVAYCCISVIAFIFTVQILIEQCKVKIFSRPLNYSVKSNKRPVLRTQILYSPVFCHRQWTAATACCQ